MTAEDRLRRILAMIPWIVAHHGPTVQETCSRFDCRPDELTRDIELLYLCGLHPYTPDLLIEAAIEDGRVFVQYADYLSRPLRLTPTEGLELVAAANSLLASPGTDLNGPLARGLAKLAGVLGSADVVDVDLGAVDNTLHQLLRDAVDQRTQVEIDYYAYGRDQTTTRLIEPRSIFSSGGAWYVGAYCHAAANARIFRVDRILRAERRPERQTGADIAIGPELLNPGTSGSRFVLDVLDDASWVREQYPIAEEEILGGGRTRLTLLVDEWPWIDRLLLRLGSQASVVSAPPDWPGRSATSDRIAARYSSSV